jgi:hypothetical protein
MKKRQVLLKPAAAAAYAALPKSERGKIDKVVDWLKYPVKERPYRLPVYRSKQIPGTFIVRPTLDLRLAYHKDNPATVVVDDIFRRRFVVALTS